MMSFFTRYYPGPYSADQQEVDKKVGRHAVFVSSALVVGLWLIKLVEAEFGLDFTGWGILPRSWSHLPGILTSPLVHGGFGHLAANSAPVFVLTFSLFFFYRSSSYAILLLTWVFSGFLVWIGGREALHIGVSGIIYGLAAFLFLSGVLSRNTGLLTISLIVALLYGSLFWGIFPLKPEISWESHLWGGISGFVLAYLYRRKAPAYQWNEEIEEEPDDDGEWNSAPTGDEPGDGSGQDSEKSGKNGES